jgi:hypothetical protein
MARMSYMGHCHIGGTLIKCTSMSVSKKQEPLFYDHVVGLRDMNFTANLAKTKSTSGASAGGKYNIQKKIYRLSRSTGSASISGPLSEGVFKNLMDLAISGEETTADFVFYTGSGKQLSSPIITSLNIDIKAGDVASFSAEFIGKDTSSSSVEMSSSSCEKLITWDKCEVSCSLSGDIVGFNLGITNPAIPIHVSGSTTDSGLGPTDIRIGMQEVKGSISLLDPSTGPFGSDTITVKVEDVPYIIKVVYGNPLSTSAAGSPFIFTLQFTGANDGPVWS